MILDISRYGTDRSIITCKICRKNFKVYPLGETVTNAAKKLFDGELPEVLLHPTICNVCDEKLQTKSEQETVGETTLLRCPKPEELVYRHRHDNPDNKPVPIMVDPRYLDTDPSMIPDKRAYSEVMKWDYRDIRKTSEAAGMILYGPPAAGKRRSIWCLFNRLAGEGVSGITVVEWGDILRVTEKATVAEITGICSSLAASQILCLTNFCATKAPVDTAAGIYSIIDSRIRMSRKTVITTSVSGDGMPGHFRPGHVDRLRRFFREYYKIVKFSLLSSATVV